MFDNISEIRVLPMSKVEFSTIEKCIDFLTNIVPNRGNTYFFRRHNMITQNNALILFQYSGKIIGYAVFLDERYFDNKIDFEKINNGYTGCYIFKPNSIKILNKFIDRDIIKKEFGVSLNQGTSRININLLNELIKYLI